MISSGLTRFVASVWNASTTIDNYGRRGNELAEGDTMLVDMRVTGKSEQPYANGVAVVSTYELRTRWPNVAKTGITELSTVTVRGKTLKVSAIRNLDERNRLAVIDCVEVA